MDSYDMPAPDLTARSRAAWEGLAGVPVTFSAAARVAVSPQSMLCPAGWVGIVVISGKAIATAPSERSALMLRRGLSTLPAAAAADAAALRAALPVADMLGPACLGYLREQDFRPPDDLPRAALPHAVASDDPELRRFLALADPADLGESGMAEVGSPVFAIGDRRRIVAVAGYRDWPGGVAHLSVLTAEHARGRGLARAASAAAVRHALGRGMFPQWRARPEASRRVARALGFTELGAQVSLRLTEQ